MKASRRGFFATLAGLPAVVMGRKAIAEPKPPIFFGWGIRPSQVETIQLTIDGSLSDSGAIARSLSAAWHDLEQRTRRRLGS